ncbi:MAG: alkaline phosphatase family protein [bacterium]|nr:alkaline phosphatase family protein [bacterium]
MDRYRWLIWLVSLGLIISLGSCGKNKQTNYKSLPQKVVVLGFDGMDAGLTAKWMKEGKLPNFSKLAEVGTFSPLQTTNPAESPVSWATFITGCNPGKHGIYDFLKRNPATYMPELALDTLIFPKRFIHIGKWRFPLESPKVVNNRKGIPLWEYTRRENIHTVVLHCPDTFPAEPCSGAMLSGLGVPDLRGTMGTFSFYSDAVTDADTEMGGKIIKVELNNDTIATKVIGPRNRFLKKHPGGIDVTLPLHITIDRHSKRVTLELQGQKQTIGLRQWSDWFTAEFKLLPFRSVSGIARFYLISIEPEFKLYLSPFNFNPENPPFQISYPADFAKKLAKRFGLYKTLGWAEDTWALNENRIDEDTFLEDLYYTFEQRSRYALELLKELDANVFIAVFEGTDRVQHMFWRYMDPKHPMYTKEGAAQYGDTILKFYQKMDEFVGQVMQELPPNTTLIVLSDHGFHSWRYTVNTNTWLVQNGFMALREDTQFQEKNLSQFFGQGTFFEHVDWSRTKAYALGLSEIYINLLGREGQGIVLPGEEYEQVRNAIIQKMKQYRNPLNGERVWYNVYKREEVFHGEYAEESGDLVVGFNDGYRTSWQTSLGGTPENIIEVNKRKWSADHCSFDPHITPGILLMNRKLTRPNPAIQDLAPTILHLLGLEKGPQMDGTTFIQ